MPSDRRVLHGGGGAEFQRCIAKYILPKTAVASTPSRGRLVLNYRGTSLIGKRTPLGPYRRPIPGVLGWSKGSGCFLMSEVPL